MGYETTQSYEAHAYDNKNSCTKCGYHAHQAVMCGQGTYSYDQANETQHIVTIQMPDLCACGEIMGYETTQSYEAHAYDNKNSCTKCGYTNHVHNLNKIEVVSSQTVFLNEEAHMLIEDALELCSCGYVIDKKNFRTNTQHTFDINNECVCGYKKETLSHIHKGVVQGTPSYSYSAEDYDVHYVTKEIPNLCECGSVINFETVMTKEVHNFQNGVCKDCNIEKSVGIFDFEASQVVNQVIGGNYSEDVTLAGIVGEILLGEIPIVGTLADLRDVYYDFQYDVGAAQKVIDVAALLPVVGGIIKYSDEIGILIKHSDELVDISGSANKPVKNFLKGGSVPDFYVGPNGKALPSQYKDWIGTNIQKELLEQAENPQLQNAIKQLYRGNSFIGDGGTADVIRFEQQTGLMLGKNGGSHVQKGIDMAKYIENKILTQDLSPSDRALATQLLEDLYSALGR